MRSTKIALMHSIVDLTDKQLIVMMSYQYLCPCPSEKEREKFLQSSIWWEQEEQISEPSEIIKKEGYKFLHHENADNLKNEVLSIIESFLNGAKQKVLVLLMKDDKTITGLIFEEIIKKYINIKYKSENIHGEVYEEVNDTDEYQHSPNKTQ
jgi:hypothetical protein